MRRISVLLAFAFLAPLAIAQSWSGLLSPNRAIDWSHAGATIPTVTTACATQPTLLTGSGNAAANVTAINNAFNADKGGASPCVINLPAGTYSMSGSWIFSYTAGFANVVIRGAGANQTFLVWQDAPLSNTNGLGGGVIYVTNGDNNDAKFTGNIQNWTAGYAQGATTVTLAANTGLKVGSVLWLLQADPGSDNGNSWYCATGSCAQTGGLTPTGFSQTQSVTVTGCGATTYGSACSSNNITISPGLYAPNWNSGQSPQARWSSNLPIQNVGFENFSTDVSAIVTSNRMIFVYMLNNTANSWLSGVRSVNGTVTGQAAHEHVFTSGSVHPTIKDSYFYGSNPASEGYGYSPADLTSDALFQNNICQHIASCIVMQTSVGSVFAYNAAYDNYFGSGWQQCDQFHHGAGDSFNLFEGNIGTCDTQDALHGTAYANTLFRNGLSGYDAVGAPGANVLTINNMGYARYMNYVANVLGYGGHSTTYQYVMASAGDCGTGSNGWVFAFDDTDQNVEAYKDPCQTGQTLGNDVTAGARPSASSMRWGNWDGVTGTVRTVTGENGSTASTWPALASPTSTYPNSLYTGGSTPAFWHFTGTAQAYPSIGPDVSTGNISGTSSHAGLNPAADNYLNKMGGSTTLTKPALTFDPTVYYSGTTTYTLSTATNGTGTGSLSCTPTGAGIAAGTAYNCTASPDAGMTLTSISGCGGTQSGSTFSGSISSDCTVTATYAALVAHPTLTPGTGTYASPQTVTLTTTTSAAVICFTTDGSTPTDDGNGNCTHGTTYSVPISVPTSRTITTKATKAGYISSSIQSAVYTITPGGTKRSAGTSLSPGNRIQ